MEWKIIKREINEMRMKWNGNVIKWDVMTWNDKWKCNKIGQNDIKWQCDKMQCNVIIYVVFVVKKKNVIHLIQDTIKNY